MPLLDEPLLEEDPLLEELLLDELPLPEDELLEELVLLEELLPDELLEELLVLEEPLLDELLVLEDEPLEELPLLDTCGSPSVEPPPPPPPQAANMTITATLAPKLAFTFHSFMTHTLSRKKSDVGAATRYWRNVTPAPSGGFSAPLGR